jgi:hypothetical protein
MPVSRFDAIINTGLKIALLCSSPLLLISQGAVAPSTLGPALSSHGDCPAASTGAAELCAPHRNSASSASLQAIGSVGNKGVTGGKEKRHSIEGQSVGRARVAHL